MAVLSQFSSVRDSDLLRSDLLVSNAYCDGTECLKQNKNTVELFSAFGL